jgi:hypothetical protein
LKRFEEQMRDTVFDPKVGKLHYQMHQNLRENNMMRREGTTYDADGNPLITKKLVGSTYPSVFGAFYYTGTYGTIYSSCDDYYLESMEVIAFDTCLAEYNYNHATKELSFVSAIKYSVTGDGPFMVTTEEYPDDDCSVTSYNYFVGTFNVSNTCAQDGTGFTSDGKFGYGAFFDSFPDSPSNTIGTYQLGFTSSKCNSYPYSGFWLSLYWSLNIYSYGSCVNSKIFNCENGVGTLYTYDYSDCSGTASDSEQYSNPMECDDYQDDEETTGNDYFTSDQAYLSSYCTAGGDGYTFTPLTSSSSSSSSSECFAGSETVTLESGESKLISEVVVGDRVLASTAQGAFVFSYVIAVPHTKNNDRVIFNEISLVNGADIRMTGEHLLPVAASCGADTVFTITAAKDVAVNSCVMTVIGQSEVVSNNKVAGTGIYTIVTNEEYVVVNGVVASPFAVSHAVGNTFYYVYRAMYKYVPGLFKSSFFQTFHATFASLAMKTW